MSKVWFTSDTHFSSGRTLEFSKRPFESIEEMNKMIIKNWNSIVGEEDTVYHLGDFGNYDVVKQLNGNVRLLCGNYEYVDLEGYIDRNHFVNVLMKKGFTSVSFAHNFSPLGIEELTDITCCHEPTRGNPYMFNLFGHIHKLQMVKKNGLNVGQDCHNFYPIDIETVLFYKNAIENHYDFEVFCG